MNSAVTPSILAFEGFYLDTRQRLLFREGGETVPLPSRAFDTLQFMATHPNELLGKEQLIRAVWPQAIVEENNLSQHISLLRKVFGEAPGEHRYIVTVPGRGFRFVPVVRALDELPWMRAERSGTGLLDGERSSLTGTEPARLPEPAAADDPRGKSGYRHWLSHARHRRWIAPAAALILLIAATAAYLQRNTGRSAREASIAVLAFSDLSPAKDQEYFSDGLSEELINQLARVPRLRVIGRTSSFAFKGKNGDPRRIGEMLGVSHLLEGSVRKDGDRVRVTATLIDPADGSQRWSATYERQLGDVFAIQDEIAYAVAAQLQLKIEESDLRAGGTRDVVAYDEFLAGRTMLASLDDAILLGAAPHFERALRLDPAFMAARLWLIDACLRTSLASVELKGAAIRRQDELIDEVVLRAPDSAEASFALSYRASRGRDLVALERLLQHASQLAGSAGDRARMRHGQFLMAVGDSAGAERELTAVVRNDPLNDFVRTQLLMAPEFAGRPVEAQREMDRFLRTPGGNAPAIHGAAIRMAQGQGDARRLAAAIHAAIAAGSLTDESAALLLQMLDDPEGARLALRALAEVSGLNGNVYFASNIAQDAAYLGDRELASQGLRAMFNSGFAFETVAFVLWRPVMRALREDPAFIPIVRDVGLEHYWRTTGRWGEFCQPAGDLGITCH